MDRPDPDELLDKIQRDEEKKQRGRLKISSAHQPE